MSSPTGQCCHHGAWEETAANRAEIMVIDLLFGTVVVVVVLLISTEPNDRRM